MNSSELSYQWLGNDGKLATRLPYSCPLCGKYFRYEQSVQRHIEAAHEMRNYICDVSGCNKTFRYQTSLFHHRRSHRNDLDKEINKC